MTAEERAYLKERVSEAMHLRLEELQTGYCILCDKELTGRQTRFCSRKCSQKVWGSHHVRAQRFERRSPHCINGHLVDDDNVYITPAGFRACRECRRLARNRRRDKVRAEKRHKTAPAAPAAAPSAIPRRRVDGSGRGAPLSDRKAA